MKFKLGPQRLDYNHKHYFTYINTIWFMLVLFHRGVGVGGWTLCSSFSGLYYNDVTKLSGIKEFSVSVFYYNTTVYSSVEGMTVKPVEIQFEIVMWEGMKGRNDLLRNRYCFQFYFVSLA
uniref:Uncharacterized protein n=1 Tax=Sphaerodactylus townsendi TaxID=933632 RepID=A0ACB8E8K1_9SAUR